IIIVDSTTDVLIGITLPSKRRRLRYSTVGLTRYRTR
ncbi:hypothetical protein ACKWLN_005097, partial [Escherichia coli]